MSTVRRVCRNVKRWRSASMALRWTAAAMQEAGAYRTFRPIGISSRLQSSQIGVSLHPD
jgi:putative transposase